MKTIVITPKKKIHARVRAPPSKAHTLRAFFISALARGESTIIDPLLADDQLTAIAALRNLGVRITIGEQDGVPCAKIAGSLLQSTPLIHQIQCRDSGVTLRFLVALCAMISSEKVSSIVLDGSPRLRERSIEPLVNALSLLGAKIHYLGQHGYAPVRAQCGTLVGGRTMLDSSMSSQFLSALLIAAPLLEKRTQIRLTSSVSSAPYVEITKDMMAHFGIRLQNVEGVMEGGQQYRAAKFFVEGDSSSAAFLFSAAALCGGSVSVANLRADSKQGDKIFPSLLQRMGCLVNSCGDIVTVSEKASKPITIDMNSFPDVVMPLAVICAAIPGQSVLSGIGHLRDKESDRLVALECELKKVGAGVRIAQDSLIIDGRAKLHGAEIDSWGDHRIAMAFGVLGLAIDGMIIQNPDVVGKSYPQFWKMLEEL